MIDVMIITYNESANLPHTLAALKGWTNKVFIIDSGSTDGTQDIARSCGAEVVHHAWEGYAKQKNWAFSNLPFTAPWTLILDADEVITSQLQKRLMEIATKPVDSVRENGFFINRITYFMGKAIRHCGYFPSWNLRLLKRGKGRYEEREVHEHIIIDDPVGYIDEPMIHEDRRGLEHYMAKHNRYSTLEATALFEEMQGRRQHGAQANITADTRRRRWVKLHVMPYMPSPGLWRFLYMYFVRLGFLDGRAGLDFSRFIGMYDSLVALKLRELRRQARLDKSADIMKIMPQGALVQPEGTHSGGLPRSPVAAPSRPQQPQPQFNGESKSAQALASSSQYTQMQPEASPWTFREKVGRAIWMLIGRPIFRLSFHNWYPYRAKIVRLFGGKVGKGVALRPTVHIEVPWMLDLDDDCTIGDHAILYSLGKIRIGKRSIISQYAHLCAGTHDYTDHTFKLLRTPVTIGDDVWIGADAFIGPGVHVGSLSVVGARSSTYKNLPEHQVCVGNPAKPIKERQLR